MQRYSLYDAFENAALVEASNAKNLFNPEDRRGRQDLTRNLVITIDPPDAQDFDDAISLTRDREGGWILEVHIADVSHFVTPGSALDRCARQRGNSVYLPGYTLPMLPEILSNGICSLQPGQPRYTKTVTLHYSKDGHLRGTRFANTIIQSTVRLSYQEADQAIKGQGKQLRKDVTGLLHRMNELARCLEKRRRQAGMLQLRMPETQVKTDPSGKTIRVEPADTCYPHTIIEMFMVEANVAVATLLDRLCIPFMRRIHPEPAQEALRQLSQTLRLLGCTLARRPQKQQLQRLLDQYQSSRVAIPINLLVLRSLARASYSPLNEGHYALAASKYCHFTSPIRRYADLLVHRTLQGYLTGKIRQARQSLSFSRLSEIGEHLTDMEQNAEDAEQELKTIMVLYHLQKRIGQELAGIVVNLTSYGATILLPKYGVEGQLARETLGPDQWNFDKQSQCLIGRYSRKVLRLAQPVRVRIVAVNPTAGQLDLVPPHDISQTSRKPAENRSDRTAKARQRRRRSKNMRP